MERELYNYFYQVRSLFLCWWEKVRSPMNSETRFFRKTGFLWLVRSHNVRLARIALTIKISASHHIQR
ncbi:MAG: hypothetical protein U7127_26165 [Phormidium sp.]